MTNLDSRDSVKGLIADLLALLSDLPGTIFANVQDRQSVADALYDTLDAAKRRETSVLGDIASRMDRFTTREEREMAGNDTLLKDEEYIGLQNEIRQQRQLLSLADGFLERKRHELEAGLKMMDLLLACARTSGFDPGDDLFSKVRRFIDSALPGDGPDDHPDPPAAGNKAGTAPALQLAVDNHAPSILEALRNYFQHHDVMTHEALQKLAAFNGFTEESVREVLRDLYLQCKIDYFENGTLDVPEVHWRLAS